MNAIAARLRIWQDEERSAVKAMLQKGATAKAVASAMQISRNAAIGRISRDEELSGLLSRAVYRPHRPARPPKPKAVAVKPEPEPEPPEPAAVQPPSFEKAKPLAFTDSRFCKWPVLMDQSALGGMLCCGQPVEAIAGAVYCAAHHAKANQPPRIRQV